MKSVVVHRGRPWPGGEGTRTHCLLPAERRAARRYPDVNTRGVGSAVAIFGCVAFARVRGRLRVAIRNTGQPASLNSFGALKALRSLFLSGLRRALQPRKQPRYGICQSFHVKSFPDAPAFHEQFSTGAIPNVREAVGEVRNVER